MNLILCTAQDINENNGNVNKNSTATITITNNNNNNNNIINKSVPRKKQKKIHKITTMKNIKAEPMNHSDGGGGGGSGGGGGGANSTTAGGGGANAGGDLDDLSDDASSTENDNFDDSDLLSMSNQDDVTAQLAAAGPVGIAAAAAIATGKKRKRPHTFETNPSIRKRQQTRLLRKLKQTIDEYTTRVGQQAVVLIVTPGKPQNNFKVFGARPLESVVRQSRASIMHDLEIALAQHAPPQVKEDPSLHELPPLVVDGIPTPVEKMTQAQLRAFIPLMLKYSTGRGKPGWGKETTRPEWWPQDLPWANVRSDARNEEEKQKVSWTHALRQIVINCYKYHNREDLLPAFSEDEDKTNCSGNPPAPKEKVKNRNQTHQQQQQQQQQHQQQQQQQSISSINVTNLAANNANITTIPITGDSASLASQGVNTLYAQPLTHYAPMVQTINNPDGSVSIIQVDPATVVAISDGNGGVRTLGSLKFQNPGGDANQNVQTLGELTTGQDHERVTQIGTVNVDLGSEGGHQSVSLAEATICPDGHIILTGEDGTQSTFPVSGMVTIPVSMYQTVVTNLNLQGDNNIPITMQQITAANQLESNGGGNGGNVVENNDNEDVKNVLNGQNTIRITTNSEENS